MYCVFVDIAQLDVKQLDQLQQGLVQEVEHFKEAAAGLTKAMNNLELAKTAMEVMVASKAKQESTAVKSTLVLLSSTVYVRAKIKPADPVLVDVGGGYFVEKSPEEGADYFRRVLGDVKRQGDEVAQVYAAKRNSLDVVQQVLVQKTMAQQQEAQAQGAPQVKA